MWWDIPVPFFIAHTRGVFANKLRRPRERDVSLARIINYKFALHPWTLMADACKMHFAVEGGDSISSQQFFLNFIFMQKMYKNIANLQSN